MKTGPDALEITEYESESAKHENGTRRPRYQRKQVRTRNTLKRDQTLSVPPKTSQGEQNMITGPNTLGTDENENGRAKHEIGTRLTRHRRKRVRALKI
jgi:hypothetical protein